MDVVELESIEESGKREWRSESKDEEVAMMGI
jgi:hypothetical protein